MMVTVNKGGLIQMILMVMPPEIFLKFLMIKKTFDFRCTSFSDEKTDIQTIIM